MHALDSGRLAPCAASVSMACEPDASTPIGLAGGAPRRHASNLAVDEFDYTGRRFCHGAVLLWLLVKKVQCLADHGLNSLALAGGKPRDAVLVGRIVHEHVESLVETSDQIAQLIGTHIGGCHRAGFRSRSSLAKSRMMRCSARRRSSSHLTCAHSTLESWTSALAAFWIAVSARSYSAHSSAAMCR